MKSRVAIFVAFLLILPIIRAYGEERIASDDSVPKTNCPVQTVSNPQFDAVLSPIRDELGNEWLQ
jgi:hypothetical protein